MIQRGPARIVTGPGQTLALLGPRWRHPPTPMTDTAVIMARGLGTRLRSAEAGAHLSETAARLADKGLKALMPIAGKPLLQHLCERLAAAGLRRGVLVIGPEQDELRHAASQITALPLACAIQVTPRGTADAVAAAAGSVADSALVMNGDNLYPVACLRACAAIAGGAVAGFTRAALVAGGIPADRVAKFSLLAQDSRGRMTRIIEKPTPAEQAELGPDALVNMNLWRLTPELMRACAEVAPSPRGELELPLAVLGAVQRGVPVQVVRSDEPVLDLTGRGDLAIVERHLR